MVDHDPYHDPLLDNMAQPMQQGWNVDVVLKDGEFPNSFYSDDLYDMTDTHVTLWCPFSTNSFHKIAITRIKLIRDSVTGDILEEF